ncbi:ABC transporter substrate-binding protein [Umezawaea tangerina]|uniref:Carbohydrate ABC transporter substrate-binding protein (CUT1 family) n=1 Tax=Umezawaea tangerina TaxID=84725 RepID=A0A2T0SAA1_9PSEU|nr:sugar ABC transporter substrate-binding protein [Umezawaea tangerina]PRY30311.1 carbohydrate ABC transporter substrate-binding protein (CUT1 family) [Umezawaea tangerina]
MPRSRYASATAALVAVGVVLAGCGSKPAATSGGSAGVAQDPNAAFEVWTRSTEATAKVYGKIFADFSAKTGVRVDYKPVFADFDKQIQQRAASKDLPDLVVTDTGSLGVFTSQGLVGEVDKGSVAGGADIGERAWDNGKASDGRYYAIPFSTQAMVTLVRKDWREKLGKPVPRTWDELADLATAFTKDDPDGNGQADTYGMLVPGTTDRGYLGWWASSFVWQGGGDVVKQDGDKFTVAVDSAETVRSVEYLRKMFCDTKVVQPGALTTGTNDAHAFFETGKTGIYVTGPYMFGRFDKNLGKDKYEVIAAPKGPAGDTVLGEGENIYLMAGSPRADAQKQLAEYLISAEAQRAGMKGDPTPVVRLPVNSKVDVDAVYDDPRWTTTAKVYADSARPFPSVPNFQPFRQQFSETLNSLFATCGGDVEGDLGKLAGNLEEELRAQGMSK